MLAETGRGERNLVQERFQSPCGDYVGGNQYFIRYFYPFCCCFSPLAGIMLAETRLVELVDAKPDLFQSPCGDYVGGNDRSLYPQLRRLFCFSPLAGIMLAETQEIEGDRSGIDVSVPLRGLCWRKLSPGTEAELQGLVSVPLRGLCWRKPSRQKWQSAKLKCFSPLAGIMLAET